ncbi:RNA-binding cell elongation regulator Jag/EloR [Ligilactobacillus ruminis]|uniref:RNA-binding cell elongation regulator Jag/EloR n=1 Tax=Ligilactobacillus ruminis TaxID=1623 RepID=UPI0009BA3C3B|nr:RNA-binding cell elongation regulator Jag/EloR [Ligilactobacillus ruminis]
MKFSAQTAEQAIEKGLQELGKTREEVEIVIISEGKKGFLGIFGGNPAEVEITPKETERVEEKDETVAEPEPSDEKEEEESEQEVEQALREVGSYLAEVTKEMGVETKIEVTVERRDVFYNFSADQEGLLIGKHGKTLNSLQLLAQNYFDKLSFKRLNIILDVADYRQRRTETLKYLAKKVAYDAISQRRRMQLDPMPAYERKVIHSALADNLKVKTYSRGAEPRRYVVIEPARSRG